MPEAIMDNVARTKEVYEVFAAGDVPRLVAEFWDPNIEWIEPESLPLGGRFVGPDAVLANVFPKIAETWGEDFHATPKEFIAAGDKVIVQGLYAGVLDGTAYEIPFCHILGLKDNKFTFFRAYVDTALRPS